MGEGQFSFIWTLHMWKKTENSSTHLHMISYFLRLNQIYALKFSEDHMQDPYICQSQEGSVLHNLEGPVFMWVLLDLYYKFNVQVVEVRMNYGGA